MDASNVTPTTLKKRKASPLLLWARQHKILAVVLFALILLVLVYVLLRFLLAPNVQMFTERGSSMLPTLKDGQTFLVDKMSYRFHAPSRGDIVVFTYPGYTVGTLAKRVIGLPGDTIAIKSVGQIYHVFVNSKLLNEPYINEPPDAPYPASCAKPKTCVPVTVPADHLFVLGDNRTASFDSRSWGYLPMKYVIGRALSG